MPVSESSFWDIFFAMPIIVLSDMSCIDCKVSSMLCSIVSYAIDRAMLFCVFHRQAKVIRKHIRTARSSLIWNILESFLFDIKNIL